MEVSLPHSEQSVAATTSSRRPRRRPTWRASTACVTAIAPRIRRELLDHYERTRAEGFGAEVKRRIILGTYVLSSGYYDAYYLRAQKVRQLIRRDFTRAFSRRWTRCFRRPRRSRRSSSASGRRIRSQMYLADMFTIAANLTGGCAISVPCGFAEAEGVRLPVGLQLSGAAFDEARSAADRLLPTSKARTGIRSARRPLPSHEASCHLAGPAEQPRSLAHDALRFRRGAPGRSAPLPIANALTRRKHQGLRTVAPDRPAHAPWRANLSGQESGKFPFMYPPTAALLLAPVSLLGQTGLIIALVAGQRRRHGRPRIVLAVRLATGSWQRQHLLALSGPEHGHFGLRLEQFSPRAAEPAAAGVDAGRFAALQEKRKSWAGRCSRSRPWIKAFPFIVIVYLLYRRYWMAAASLAACCWRFCSSLLAGRRFVVSTQARADVQTLVGGDAVQVRRKRRGAATGTEQFLEKPVHLRSGQSDAAARGCGRAGSSVTRRSTRILRTSDFRRSQA